MIPTYFSWKSYITIVMFFVLDWRKRKKFADFSILFFSCKINNMHVVLYVQEFLSIFIQATPFIKTVKTFLTYCNVVELACTAKLCHNNK